MEERRESTAMRATMTARICDTVTYNAMRPPSKPRDEARLPVSPSQRMQEIADLAAMQQNALKRGSYEIPIFTEEDSYMYQVGV